MVFCILYSGLARDAAKKFGMMRACLAQEIIFSALALFMALVFGADDHNFAVPFDDFAFVAHGFDRRSDFHIVPP